uniref:Uncharacterized protein n=1 Tax=Oncorhynchus mykiss TaxID=8022 RepID=A0A8C7R1D8_ONCMY
MWRIDRDLFLLFVSESRESAADPVHPAYYQTSHQVQMVSLLTSGCLCNCAVDCGELQCSLSPAGALHPVQGLLERFEAGPGCAARESGEKETHVIAGQGFVGKFRTSPACEEDHAENINL